LALPQVSRSRKNPLFQAVAISIDFSLFPWLS
jgi:hypothetical protein